MGAEQRQLFSLPDGVEILTVTQLTERVRSLFESEFPKVWVEGEISNLKRHTSGHTYFTLRDAGATLRCVLYRFQALRLPKGYEPSDGQEVVALGRMNVYSARGEYQLLVDRMVPKGIGAAEQALNKLREKLFKLGYFDQKRKRRLPEFPKSVCLIASATGAAVHDMIKVFRHRWPATLLFVRPSRVQGEGAAEEIAEAIGQVNRWHLAGYLPIDVMILGRGGGSSEDLAAFNTEIVAQAIFRSKIPIVSAVGHEIDLTIADLVADVRAATPSHAVEQVAPDRRRILEVIEEYRYRLVEGMRRTLRERRQRLIHIAGRTIFRRPADRFREMQRRLDDLAEHLHRSLQRQLTLRHRELTAISQRLDSLSPLAILARGYSLTRHEQHEGFIRSAQQVAPGDRIVTIVQYGSILSRVEAITARGDN